MIEETQRKLREASFFLQRLIDERQRSVRNEPEAFQFYLSAFLSASRSVTFVLQAEEKPRYDVWFPNWRAQRSQDDQDLLTYMNTQRVAEVHQVGANVDLSWVPIPYIGITAREVGDPLYSFQFSLPGTQAPIVKLPTYHFGLPGTKMEVTDACARYFQLVAEIVHEFIRDHPSP